MIFFVAAILLGLGLMGVATVLGGWERRGREKRTGDGVMGFEKGEQLPGVTALPGLWI